MKYLIIISFSICVFGATALAFESASPLTDREIIEPLTELKSSVANLDRRMDDIKGLPYVIIAAIFGLIGFVLWDRRTALAPAMKKNEAIERALIGFSEKHPDMKDELKHAGVL